MMFIVHVHVHVHANFIEDFREATLLNASHSVTEPGVARFDVVQDLDDPTHFVLVEVYRTTDAPGKHKETAHYKLWRETVARMMAEPRRSERFSAVFPGEEGW